MRLLDLKDLADLIVMVDRWVCGQGDAVREAVLGTTWGVWHLAIERSNTGAELRTFSTGLRRLEVAIRDRFDGIAFVIESFPRGTELSLFVDTDHAVRFPAAGCDPDVCRN